MDGSWRESLSAIGARKCVEYDEKRQALHHYRDLGEEAERLGIADEP